MVSFKRDTIGMASYELHALHDLNSIMARLSTEDFSRPLHFRVVG